MGDHFLPSVDLEECCVELNLPQPLLGSAPESTALVVIDCPKPWNSKVQASSGFPADWLEALEEAKKQNLEHTVLGRAGTQEGSLVYRRFQGKSWQRSCATKDELLAALGEPVEGWQPAEPAILICTHGSRDTCCGRLGVPILQAAREAGGRAVFESSHLGGHRFAPTMLVLPEWRYYGRLPEDKFAEFWESLDANDLRRLPYLRGSGYVSELAQVVEGEVAKERGAWPDDVRLITAKKLGNTHSVEVALAFGDQDVRVKTVLTIEMFRGPVSCSDVPIGLSKETEAHRLSQPLQFLPA